MSATIPNGALLPPGVAAPAPPPATTGSPSAAGGASFAAVLASQPNGVQPVGGIRFSRHALDRLQRRGIEVGPQTLQRLSNGIAQAAAKGSRDSVVFVDGTAFVASVKNNTVITAVGSEHMREHVFTNIDSAVIA